MAKGLAKEVVALGAVLGAVEGLELEEQRWVFVAALSKLGLEKPTLATVPAAGGAAGGRGIGGGGDAPTPKEFLRLRIRSRTFSEWPALRTTSAATEDRHPSIQRT